MRWLGVWQRLELSDLHHFPLWEEAVHDILQKDCGDIASVFHAYCKSLGDKTKEAAMSAFLALTYFVFPGASLQILKGLARDERFDNDPEYFEDWQTGKGAPKSMCRLQYDREWDTVVGCAPILFRF